MSPQISSSYCAIMWTAALLLGTASMAWHGSSLQLRHVPLPLVAYRSPSYARWHGALPHGALRAPPAIMAGFGAPAGPKKSKGGKSKPAKGKGSAAKPEGLNAKRQWEIFRELRDKSDQCLTSSVYARLPEEKWLNVGGVIVEAPGSRIEGVAMHKRLILEHASRLHLKLAMKPKEIEIGFSDTSVESLPSDDARIEPLTKCAVPATLVAGFQGLPDQKSGMYILGTQIRAAK